MQSYRYANCGASVTIALRDYAGELKFVQKQCGKLPAEHGVEFDRGIVSESHPFVLTQMRGSNA